MADYPNTQTETQTFRQDEKTEKFIINERTGQGLSQRSKQNRFKILLDEAFKATITRILTGLEERVEDMRKTLNTDEHGIQKRGKP